jgi:hypothetical protein
MIGEEAGCLQTHGEQAILSHVLHIGGIHHAHDTFQFPGVPGRDHLPVQDLGTLTRIAFDSDPLHARPLVFFQGVQ